MPWVKVSGGTWGSSVTLCHSGVGQERSRRCHPGSPCPDSGQPRCPCGWLGPSTCSMAEELVLGQEGKSWAGEMCWFSVLTLLQARGWGSERACGAQEEEGLSRAPMGQSSSSQHLLPAPPSSPHQLLLLAPAWTPSQPCCSWQLCQDIPGPLLPQGAVGSV